jgi:hypothetical protein
MNPKEEINRIKSIMGLLTEEDNGLFDSLDWIKDVKPYVPITDLGPGEKYKFHYLPEKSLISIHEDSDLKNHDLYHTIFMIDKKEGFYNEDVGVSTDYADVDTTDFWLIPADVNVSGGWVATNGVMVIKVG